MSLEFDVIPLFEQINVFIPVFLPIIAIGGGIAIAMRLPTMLINFILRAIGWGDDQFD